MGSPVFWVGQHDENGPHGEGWKDLEGFGKGSGLVPRKEVTDSDCREGRSELERKRTVDEEVHTWCRLRQFWG